MVDKLTSELISRHGSLTLHTRGTDNRKQGAQELLLDLHCEPPVIGTWWFLEGEKTAYGWQPLT